MAIKIKPIREQVLRPLVPNGIPSFLGLNLSKNLIYREDQFRQRLNLLINNVRDSIIERLVRIKWQHF